jgi:hypothetical protein
MKMMGQQQETVAGTTLRRIATVVLVAALMALTMSVMSAPALAANGSFSTGGKTALVKSDNKASKGIHIAEANNPNNQ